MTVHYELPTATDFSALAGVHHPAITIYASTSPVVSERELAQVAVKSSFDDAIEQARAGGAESSDVDALRAERDRVLAQEIPWEAIRAALGDPAPDPYRSGLHSARKAR